MYYATKIQINQNHPLFQYCDAITKAANNLKNATLFRVRQVFTMVEKPTEQLTSNEKEVYSEIENALPLMGSKYKMPQKGKSTLSYTFLDALMKATHNPDYYNAALPSHGAQHVLKEVTENMKSFREALKEYSICPSRFTGRPKLPKYAIKGGNHAITLSNQE